MNRNYEKLLQQIPREGASIDRMKSVVDAIWDAFNSVGVSWVGFYVHSGGEELFLDYCRNKPACSPIGMHGACGTALTTRKPLVVRDVAELGENYIACDPRDRSEVVIPCFDEDDRCWAVLDLDSFDIGAFDQADVDGLTNLLKAAGLTR